MKILDANFGGVYLIRFERKGDERGYFQRLYSRKEFSEIHLNNMWPQINLSKTIRKGTVRGLHFQTKPSEEIKLVTCLNGTVFDVVVDIRPNSKYFGQWRSFEISDENGFSIYIPKGFAHGFQALSDDCILSYLMSCKYNSKMAKGLAYNDPGLNILWPLPVCCISEADKKLPFLQDIAK